MCHRRKPKYFLGGFNMKRTDLDNPAIVFVKSKKGRVDPAYLLEILEKLPKDSKVDVVVNGILSPFDKEEKAIDINVNGNFYCVGILDPRVNLNVKGNLVFDSLGIKRVMGHTTVEGDIALFHGEFNAKSIRVNGSFITFADVYSSSIVVGGDFALGPRLGGIVKSDTIDVGGDFVCPMTVLCPSIRVLGDIECLANCKGGFEKAIKDMSNSNNIIQCNQVIVRGYYKDKIDWHIDDKAIMKMKPGRGIISKNN